MAGSRETASTVDAGEVERFGALASRWWDPEGPMAPLHRINPLRLRFVRNEVARHRGRDDAEAPFPLDGLDILDVGCGAGLLSEPLARLGAAVTAIDPAAASIAAARAHAEAGGLAVDYRAETVEAVAAAGRDFDVVVAMEVVEHVPDVDLFLRGLAAVTRPGGLVLLSTLNRTWRAYALAIVGAEYVLGWLPRGTHDWDKFVTPDELRDGLRRAGLARFRARGMVYDPLGRAWRLSDDTAVNYLASAARPVIP